jgi:hypothetical protein
MFNVGVKEATVVELPIVTGATSNVRELPLRSRLPTPLLVIEEIEPAFADVAVILPFKANTPVPIETNGAVLPPMLLIVKPASVWLKLFKFNVDW